MAEQVVRPAGAGHEALFVALACAVIVALAAAVIGARQTPAQRIEVAAHQLDARDDLLAAEQGLYADLRLVPGELADFGDRPPAVTELAEALLPPFVADVGTAWRGDHAWTLIEHGAASAYLGLSAAPEVAGSMLLRLSGPADAGEADIWLNRSPSASPPARLDTEYLVHGGWQQVVTHFDAGATRHRH
ncbi:hypothetical protein E6C76_04650 [Pseudothauera nasutitermitis]|uniref:Periplasmic protein n=1 Tax=Pseudothauera nasutitermitis TaxID=2565930 RepID=A0A4S4B0T7_9RHOO|nr:DUF6162 family protein [Pseudothauera nasutitermitis]THF66152.1 hypothetical protein E6C76_04650 [Pseudothauera nasutitermitis]